MAREIGASFKIRKGQLALTPIRLVWIPFSSGDWCGTDWSESITFGAFTYEPYPFTVDGLEVQDSMPTSASIKLAYSDNLMEKFEADEGGIGLTVEVLTVFHETLSDPEAYIKDRLIIQAFEFDGTIFSLSLEEGLNFSGVSLPRNHFTPYCRWDFKSPECGYAGSETFCSKTLQRCKELGNELNFGGFAFIPPGETTRII